MDTMAAIRETFFQECEEQLGELEVGLNAMDEGVADSETVNAVFRAVHSIKGGAGAFKLDRLVRFAHTFETALDLIRSDKLAPTTAVLKTMLRCADVLADLVKAARFWLGLDETMLAVALVAPDILDEAEAVELRHVDVGDNDLRRLLFENLESVLAVDRLDDAITRVHQRDLEHVAHGARVIHG